MRIDNRKQCECGATDEAGEKIKHSSTNKKECLNNPKNKKQKGKKRCVLLMTCNGVIDYMLVFIVKPPISYNSPSRSHWTVSRSLNRMPVPLFPPSKTASTDTTR